MVVYSAIISLACVLQLTQALPTDQQPLNLHPNDNVQTVRAELKKAEIIPTVIDDFLPSLTLHVSWKKKKATAKLGNTLKPKHTQSEPQITLYDETSSSEMHKTRKMQYVVTLTDPDAPSRDDPKWSEMCHWIASNVSITTREEKEEGVFKILPLPEYKLSFDDDEDNQNTLDKKSKSPNPTLAPVMPYKPPGPPPKTGKHRYVFLVFAPRNGTGEPLRLSRPKERRHWGSGTERGGVREWAGENGLVPVAGNFVYAMDKKQ